MRTAPSSVRFLSTSNVHNDDSCGKSKAAALDKKTKILREKTPIGKLEELEGASHPFQEKEPLKPFPSGVNPITGTSNYISDKVKLDSADMCYNLFIIFLDSRVCGHSTFILLQRYFFIVLLNKLLKSISFHNFWLFFTPLHTSLQR